MKFPNDEAANAFVEPKFRDGWSRGGDLITLIERPGV